MVALPVAAALPQFFGSAVRCAEKLCFFRWAINNLRGSAAILGGGAAKNQLGDRRSSKAAPHTEGHSPRLKSERAVKSESAAMDRLESLSYTCRTTTVLLMDGLTVRPTNSNPR